MKRQFLLLAGFLGVALSSWGWPFSSGDRLAENVTAEYVGKGEVRVSWTISDASLYKVYYVWLSRSDKPNASAGSRDFVQQEDYDRDFSQALQQRSMIDKPPVGGKTYYYWVHSSTSYTDAMYLADGASLYWPELLSVQCTSAPVAVYIPGGDLEAPEAPDDVMATANVASITVSWSSAEGAASYRVFRGTSVDTLSVVGSVDSVSFEDTNVLAGVEYHYAVKSVSATGALSEMSERASAMVSLMTPGWVSVTNGVPKLILGLCCETVPLATGYDFYIADTSEATEGELLAVADDRGSMTVEYSDFVISNITERTLYVWAVARCGEARSEPSEKVELPLVVAPLVELKPVGGSFSAGRLELAISTRWEHSTSGLSYRVYRSTEDFYEEGDFILEASGEGFSDGGFGSVGGVRTVKYWARPVLGGLRFSASDACETRRRRALLVGLENYAPERELEALPGCAQDVRAFREMLESRGCDTNCSEKRDAGATRIGLQLAFEGMSAVLRPGDIFIYLHSGHGGYGEGEDEYVLCLYDKDLTDSEFASFLRPFKAGVGIVVLLDTCSSGGMPFDSFPLMTSSSAHGARTVGRRRRWAFAEGVSAALSSLSIRPTRSAGELDLSGTGFVPKTISESDIGWITAVNEDQYSLDGLFTGEVIHDMGWLNGGADALGNADGVITFGEVAAHAKRVLGRASNLGCTPTTLHDGVLSSVVAGHAPAAGLSFVAMNEVVNVRCISHPGLIKVLFDPVPGATHYVVADCTDVGNPECRFPVEPSEVFGPIAGGEIHRFSVSAFGLMDASPVSDVVEGEAGDLEPLVGYIRDLPHWDVIPVVPGPPHPFAEDGTIIPENLAYDHDGDGICTYDECVAGTDPTDPSSVFRAKLKVRDGKPEITWEPDLNKDGGEVRRVYTIWGKKSLGDSRWQLSPGDDARFFKVEVGFP